MSEGKGGESEVRGGDGIARLYTAILVVECGCFLAASQYQSLLHNLPRYENMKGGRLG